MITIVIPTYKRAHLLRRLLCSIQQQTYRNFEVVVVNDCSDQEEAYQNVIQEYCEMFRSLVYLRNTANLGAPATRNRGISHAKGEWIALVDDDDEWHPEKLQKQVAIIEKGDPSLGFVYTWTKAIDENVVVHEYCAEHEGCPLSELLLECFIPSPSVIVRRQAIVDAGLFDVALPSCQDWDMWVRILSKGYTCAVVKSFETLYHKHGEESIGTSPRVCEGYRLYYKKHMSLYRKWQKKLYLKMKIKQLLRPLWKSIF